MNLPAHTDHTETQSGGSTPPQARYGAFLEGMRGAAALYVVLHHIHLHVDWVDGLGRFVELRRPLNFGHYAVAVFIVLSGYCLMIPVAAAPDGRPRGGFVAYIYRRAKRILPPYFAVLALVLAAISLVPRWQESTGTHWDTSLPALTPDVITSHVFLVQNLRKEWIFKIDSPLWSVATEWQIYFAFPALLWLWRRCGMGIAVGIAFLVGYGLFLVGFVMRQPAALEACPWYLGLFAIGMAAALKTTRWPTAPRRRWIPLMFGCLVIGAALFAIEGKFGLLESRGVPRRVILDSIFGAATACLIIHCAQSSGRPGENHSWIVRILESGPARWLGSFSYSLYLIHDPLLAWLNLGLIDANLSDQQRMAVMFGAGLPGVILAAYLFYLVFERPFLNRVRRAR
ncbi:acyltransferase family protein [Zavarzinella formosa]|uniref:acyltransferase family protein n=1 Tax=Zavarzinella formosa TaxID=360055 RepID=UPI0012FADEA1|nr:acyltransferase [Zavarzinella formosa]